MKQQERLDLDAQLVVLLKRAVVENNESLGFQIAQKLFSTNPEWYGYAASPEESEIRRMAHEVLDEFLRQLVFSPAKQARGWHALLVPTKGVVMAPILATNARWLRLFGSPLPDQQLETLDVPHLAKRGFVEQAKTLGRFMVVNDAAATIDYTALHTAVDKRLHSALANWVAGVYLGSPDNLADAATTERQSLVSQQFLALHHGDSSDLCGTPIYSNIPVRLSYRSGFDIKRLAETLNGNLNRRVLDTESRDVPDPSLGALESRLVQGGDVVFCPNWTPEHVAYRCMSDAVEGVRSATLRIVAPQEGGNARAVGPDWQSAAIHFPFANQHPFRAQLKSIGNAIARAETELLFFPEVTPNNASLLLATQRCARIQAAGYGYPVTTGSPAMDYFVGGADVELDGAEYTEQLLLLPGLGVSTTPPPLPSTTRTRGFREAQVHVVCIASWQKLNQPLIQSWEAILGDQPQAAMDLFPCVHRGQVETLYPTLAANVDRANINLHLTVPRVELLNVLENADVYLDTFPYGGFNSLVEVLCAGIPFVTLEGRTARERFGAALLRRLNLPDFLITHSIEEFVRVSRQLIQDADLRMDVRARIGTRAQVLAKLIDADIGVHFAAAVAFMKATGPRTGQAGPQLLIQAGQAPIEFHPERCAPRFVA